MPANNLVPSPSHPRPLYSRPWGWNKICLLGLDFGFLAGVKIGGEAQAMTVAFIDVECFHSLQCKITAKSLA